MTDGVAPAEEGPLVPIGTPYTYVYYLHVGGIGFVCLASKDRGDNFQQRFYRVEDCLRAGAALDEQRNWYLSPNAFRAGNRRRSRDVVSVRANWIDLDYYRSDMADLSAEEVWEKALELLKLNETPIPQMAVSTGRGLQLLWIFPKGLPAAIAPRWTAVQKGLLAMFGDFGPDATASNICGVLRIPGTVNMKSGRRSYFVRLDVDSRTNFDALSRAVTPFRRPKEPKRQIPSARGLTLPEHPPLRVEANRDTAAAVVQDIERLIRGRGVGHKPMLSQLPLLFILGHFVRRAVGRETFWERFMHLADAIPELSDREKRETAKSVLAFRGRYSTVGAAARLGVTDEEVEKFDLKRLLPAGARNDGEKLKRRRERARLQKTRARRSDGQRPQSESLAAARPWDLMGVSRATFFRHVRREPP